jgi:site-specific DNA-methyltransferase (adenine-specific)
MNPLDGTFANNALKHGVAGLWIDGGRIPTTDIIRSSHNVTIGGNGIYQGGRAYTTGALPGQGRWPANLILDEEAAAMLDEQSGERPTGVFVRKSSDETTTQPGGWHTGPRTEGRFTCGDTGGASRFFYCAKASRAERNADGLVDNDHATVKPLDLIRYLVRLTKTPTGGTVLDPFCGSGTMLKACSLEGRSVIGIDILHHNCEIAVKRLAQRSLFEVGLQGG